MDLEIFNDTLFDNNVTNLGFDFNVSLFQISSFPVARLRAVKVVFQLLLLVGLLGNALVIAVHVNRLNTSTKIYMFSLAVADAFECAVGMVTGAWMFALGVVIRTAIVYIVHVAVVFSMTMLSFVALERCMAVLRPHHFSLNTRRASIAVTVIAIFAVVYAAAAVLAKTPPFHPLYVPLRVALTGTVLVVIFVSYNTVGILLLFRAHHRKRAVRVALTLSTNVNSTTNSGAGTSNKTVTPKCTNAPQQKTQSDAGASRGKKTVTPKSTNAPEHKSQSRMFLLFVVTVMCIACWLPFWLYTLGVPMPHQLSQVYVLHPFVNPMIYISMSSMFRELVREFYHNTRNKLARCWC